MREKFLKPEAENKFHRRKLTYIYYSPLPVSPPSPLSPPLPVSPPSPLSPPLPFFPACFLSCCIRPFLPPFSPRLTCSGDHNPPPLSPPHRRRHLFPDKSPSGPPAGGQGQGAPHFPAPSAPCVLVSLRRDAQAVAHVVCRPADGEGCEVQAARVRALACGVNERAIRCTGRCEWGLEREAIDWRSGWTQTNRVGTKWRCKSV